MVVMGVCGLFFVLYCSSSWVYLTLYVILHYFVLIFSLFHVTCCLFWKCMVVGLC